MALRKNQRNLNAWEKRNFCETVLALKAEQKPGNTNTYDQYVKLHYDNVLAGHFGPAFFAWHREFLRRFEGELQRITGDKSFGLPYWDWSVDNSKTSSIWGPDFMGGNGNAGLEWQVQDGPFAYSARNQGDPRKWSLNVRTSSEPFPYLRRQLETYIPSLPTPADVQAALQTTPYDVAPWDDTSLSGFRNTAEGYIPDPPRNRDAHPRPRVGRWIHDNNDLPERPRLLAAPLLR
jgi:tyrosinase